MNFDGDEMHYCQDCRMCHSGTCDRFRPVRRRQR